MGLKNLTYAYMGVGEGVKNCQNHAYVINEWRLSTVVQWSVLCNSDSSWLTEYTGIF